MVDWLVGICITGLVLATLILALIHETEKPTNEQIAACVLACKGHLTDMMEYHSQDVAKDGNFTCHCKMTFKISKDGSNIIDLQ